MGIFNGHMSICFFSAGEALAAASSGEKLVRCASKHPQPVMVGKEHQLDIWRKT